MSQVNVGIEWRGRLWAYAPLFLWIGVIFMLSSPQASMSETSRIIGPLINFFFPDISDESRRFIHVCVRKTAHLTEYAMLGLLAARAFASTISLIRWRYLLAIALVAAIASLDEYYQSFLASRTSTVWDVVLDIFGGAVAVCVLWLVRKWRFRPQQNKITST